MKSLRLSMMFSAILVIAGCSNLPMYAPSQVENSNNQVAVLTDYELDNGFITIQAMGYGCTFFNSFKVAKANNKVNSLKVVRTKPDNCGMKPRVVSLQYSFKHLGLDLEKDIQVVNPIDMGASEPLVKN